MHKSDNNNISDVEKLKQEYQEYIYKISHDLSGPFRQIQGFANIINRKYSDIFDSKSQQHMQLILKGAEKGICLVEGLLELSRVETHPCKMQTLHSSVALRNAREMLFELETASEAEYIVDDLPEITGDKLQICQLFYQIIHNALLYHATDNKPVINITVSEQEDQWLFSVIDNGLGIPENRLKEIFHPFKRFNENSEHLGVGLGLSIADRIIERHHGSIWAESTPGEGTKLYFTVSKTL